MNSGILLLITVIASWIASQTIKMFFHDGTTNEPWWWRSGGFPSAHTAPAAALVMGVLLIEGFSVLFVVCFVFLVAIIRDAVGVRYAAGVNGVILKESLGKSALAKKVVVEKGHTLIQTVAGLLVGFAMALAIIGL